MASMGSLVVNLGANTRQFDSAIARSQQAMQAFGRGASKAAEAAHALDVLSVGKDTASQLQDAAAKMTDLQAVTEMAATQARRFEHAAHQAASAVTIAGTGMLVATKGASAVAKGTATASHGMHAVVVVAIAVRRTLESLAWAFGVVADGARVLLAPLRMIGRAFSIVLAPLRMVGSAVLIFAKAVGMVVGPLISMASGVLTVYTYFKAFQLQIKLTRAILDMLPPKIKAVATVLFTIGLASRVAGAALRMFGTAGKWAASAVAILAAPIRALMSPLKTLEAAVKKTGGALRSFISSAATPLKIALSGLGAVAAVGGMLKLAADAETLSLQMKVLTKDAAAAKQLVDNLNQFALTVPFDKMEIKQAATQLLAVQTPVNEIIGDMRVLANLAAGSGQSITELTDIFATFRSQGTIAMQDILQLQRRGINIVPELTKKFGDLDAALEQGRVGFYDIREALYTLTSGTGQFAGMTDELAKSMAGQFAQLKNNVLIVATAIGEQMRPAITEALTQLNAFVQSFMAMDSKIKFIGDLLKATFAVVFAFIEEQFNALLTKMQAKARGMIPGLESALKAKGKIAEMFGFASAEPAPAAGGQAMAKAQADLANVLARLKPAVAPPKPVAPVAPPPAPGAAGKQLGAALGDFVGRLQGEASPVVDGLLGWLNKKMLGGAMFANRFSQMVGGDGGQSQKQESKVAGALQKGSADAFSAIVSAMGQRADPVVKATKEQTKQLQKPLVDIVGLIKEGGLVKVLGAFAE